MTDERSPLDTYGEAFRTGLGDAHSRLTRQRRRRTRALGASATLAAVATIAVAAWPGDRTTVLERAEAALSPKSGVLHFRVSSELIGAAEPPCTEDPADVWMQTGPNAPQSPSWRLRIPTSRCLTEPLPEALGHLRTGGLDLWFDGRNTSRYAFDDGWVEHLTDVPARDAAFPDPTGITGGGTDNWWESVDPIAGLRRLLASGRVRPAGTGTLDGRQVSYFEGASDQGSGVARILRIAVDTDTGAPVEITDDLAHPEQAAGRDATSGTGTRARFDEYEVATADDLAPRIPAGTDEASRDYREFRKAVRAAKAYPPEPVAAAERARAEQRFAELHPNATTP